jgi:uncharacterized membrane protein YoaK (UPF0700 family)
MSSSAQTPSSVGTLRHDSVPIPSVDQSLPLRLLPFVLSLAAGSVDVIGFLGLDELFTAHITGNLVVLPAHLVADKNASLALVMSVPLFIVMLVVTRLFATALERYRITPLRPLLFLQFALLCGFLGICLAVGPDASAEAPTMLAAGMLGVSAMAVQNALVRIALVGAPSTAVLTTDITLLTTDIGEIMLGREADRIANARRRVKHTWPAVLGFLLGCALGALFEARIGLRALVLPVGFAFVALALAMSCKLHNGYGSTAEK